MAERTDIIMDWALSPRLADVALPSDELNAQDAHDTLNSNTRQPGMADDTLDNMDDDPTIDSAGKEGLGGGTEVGITSTLLNTQIAFGRTSSRSSGSVTTGDTVGRILIDSGADFVTDQVRRGDWVINFTDQSVTEVLTVDSPTQLTCRPLSDGTDNRFDSTDLYKVWAVEEASLSGGNFVALDDVDAEINPLFTTFGRFATRTSASSATATSQAALESGLFNNVVIVDVLNVTGNALPGTGNAPDGTPIGTRFAPSDNIADALFIAQFRGLRVFRLASDLTVTAGDFSAGYQWESDNVNTELVLNPAADVTNNAASNITISGEMDGFNRLFEAEVGAITEVSGTIYNCNLNSTIGLNGPISIIQCFSGITALGYPDIINVGSNEVIVRDMRGSIGVDDMTGGSHSIGVYGGRLIIGANCTGGTIYARGDPYEITDFSGGAVTIVDQTASQKVTEIWQDRGNDPNNPKQIDEITPKLEFDETVGNITKEVRKSGSTTVITRQ